jgi:hypothetical protein
VPVYDDMLSPEDEQNALIAAIRRSPALAQPTQGAEKKPNFRQYALAAALRGTELPSRPVDTAQMVEAYRQASEGAGGDIKAGLALSMLGGKRLAPFGEHVLKQAMQARQPQQVGDYGTIQQTSQGPQFITNPFKQREIETAAQGRLAPIFESMARDVETAEEKRLSAQEREAGRRETMTMHQQNLAEARADRAAARAQAERHFQLAQEQGRYQPIKDPEGNITALVETRSGRIVRPEAIAPAATPGMVPTRPPKLNAEQSKEYGYGQRIYDANQIIDEVGPNYSITALATKQGLEKVPGLGGALGVGANVMLDENTQRVEQAQRNFINSVLRRESGAAISPSEFAEARKQYFPQPGDKPEVLANKKANRERQFENLRMGAGPAAQYMGGPTQDIGQRPGLPKATAPKGSPKERANDYLRRAGGDT